MATQRGGNPPEKKDSVSSAVREAEGVPPVDPPQKLRIACIHGFRTSGKILAQQIRMANWGTLIDDIVELVFVDGPRLAAGKSSVEEKFDGPYYEWYQSSADFTEAIGVEESTAHFLEFLSLNGPFDGLLGFSQGGVLAAVWIGLSEKGLGMKLPNINFLIEIAGGRAKANVFQPAYESTIQCPSIHFFGAKDHLKTFGEELVPVFKDPVVISHPFGHVVPRLSASEGQMLRDFLLKQQQAKHSS